MQQPGTPYPCPLLMQPGLSMSWRTLGKLLHRGYHVLGWGCIYLHLLQSLGDMRLKGTRLSNQVFLLIAVFRVYVLPLPLQTELLFLCLLEGVLPVCSPHRRDAGLFLFFPPQVHREQEEQPVDPVLPGC